MAKAKKKVISIRPRRVDLDRFAYLVGDRKQAAAATAWAGLRALQTEFGPGHAALDLLASELPEAYRRNWAKKLLAA